MSTEKMHEGKFACLFTDIEKHSDLAEALGPVKWTEIALKHDACIRDCIQEFHGHSERTEGDSFFATFSSSTQAMRCAVAIQKRLHEKFPEPLYTDKAEQNRFLHVRIGVRCTEYDIFPTSENTFRDVEIGRAQRVMSCGVGEQILVSATTWQAGNPYLEGIEAKTHPNNRIRNFEGPQTLYELLWDDKARAAPGARWTPDFLLHETNQFVGRTADLEKIDAWRTGNRPALLLHGHGGIGKTRLMAEAVRSMGSYFEGYIYGISLDRDFGTSPEKATSAKLAQLIAAAVQAPEEVQNRLVDAMAAPKKERLEQSVSILSTYLNQKFDSSTFLLVLDNFESANNPETRTLLGELIQRVNSLRCMMTCRVQFEIDPVLQSYEIQGLDLPTGTGTELESTESYQLFRTRVEQSHPARSLTDTAAIIRILQATEGIALYIELIAARYRLTPRKSLQIIADELEKSRLSSLRVPEELNASRADSPRHQSSEACLDWSLQCLPKAEQKLWPRLGIFFSDFDIDAAQAILEFPATKAEATIDRWILAHMLQCEEGSGRLHLQPVLREFAGRRLPAQEGEPLQEKFIAYYTDLAESNANLNSLSQRSRRSVELRNLHAAANILCSYKSLTSKDARNLMVLGIALNEILTGLRSENQRKSIACYEAALRVYTEQETPHDWAMTQNNLGNAYSDLLTGDRAENLKRAIACYEAALRVYTEQETPHQWAMTQNNLGNAYWSLPTGDRAENLKRAIACYEAALRVRTEQETPHDWANTQYNLALLHEDLGDRIRAKGAMQQASRGYRSVGAVRDLQDAEEWLQSHPETEK